jgi:hypothetical protein
VVWWCRIADRRRPSCVLSVVGCWDKRESPFVCCAEQKGCVVLLKVKGVQRKLFCWRGVLEADSQRPLFDRQRPIWNLTPGNLTLLTGLSMIFDTYFNLIIKFLYIHYYYTLLQINVQKNTFDIFLGFDNFDAHLF